MTPLCALLAKRKQNKEVSCISWQNEQNGFVGRMKGEVTARSVFKTDLLELYDLFNVSS